MLRVGQIEYANCTPVYHVLKKYFPCSGYSFVKGVPTELNRLLEAGGIDVCPSSSFEYALHSEKYRILPDLSISSDGAVASVLLFSRIPIEELGGSSILLSSESATSVNLLKILMAQRYGLNCSYSVTSRSATDALADSSAILLIGDAALRASMTDPGDMYIYDLGTLWLEWTGLPFVFALWLCRRDVASSESLLELSDRLVQAIAILPEHFTEISGLASEASWMGSDRLVAYWCNNIQYGLEERKISGLKMYFKKCGELGLIDSVPELRFI